MAANSCDVLGGLGTAPSAQPVTAKADRATTAGKARSHKGCGKFPQDPGLVQQIGAMKEDPATIYLPQTVSAVFSAPWQWRRGGSKPAVAYASWN